MIINNNIRCIDVIAFPRVSRSRWTCRLNDTCSNFLKKVIKKTEIWRVIQLYILLHGTYYRTTGTSGRGASRLRAYVSTVRVCRYVLLRTSTKVVLAIYQRTKNEKSNDSHKANFVRLRNNFLFWKWNEHIRQLLAGKVSTRVDSHSHHIYSHPRYQYTSSTDFDAYYKYNLTFILINIHSDIWIKRNET